MTVSHEIPLCRVHCHRQEDLMDLPRRKFLHLAAGAAAVSAVSTRAWAQTYPSHSLRLIVPFLPGRPNDVFVRLFAHWLSVRLGQPAIIDTRPGTRGNTDTV